MHVKAHHYNARMSPRKLRLLRSLLVGLPVKQAVAQLAYLPGKGPQIIDRVLRSAVANAKHNYELAEVNLKVSDLIIGEATTMKRFRPVSKGQAHPIKKYTAHVTIVVTDEVKQ